MRCSKKRDKLEETAKRYKGGYVLTLDNENYYLPSNTFQEHTYIYEYGLKYQPDYVKEYIAGKVFFDIGAFMGDTSTLLERKYKPPRICLLTGRCKSEISGTNNRE